MKRLIVLALLSIVPALAIETWVKAALGGPDVVDATGWTWKGTPCPTGSTPYVVTTLNPAVAAAQPVYVSMCSSTTAINLAIDTQLPGNYLLKLYFYDPQSAPTGRTFDISVNGQVVQKSMSVSGQAGGTLKPWTMGYPVYATQSKINLSLTKVSGNVILSGYELSIVRDGNLLPAGNYSTQRFVPDPTAVSGPNAVPNVTTCETGDWSKSADNTKLFLCVGNKFKAVSLADLQ